MGPKAIVPYLQTLRQHKEHILLKIPSLRYFWKLKGVGLPPKNLMFTFWKWFKRFHIQLKVKSEKCTMVCMGECLSPRMFIFWKWFKRFHIQLKAKNEECIMVCMGEGHFQECALFENHLGGSTCNWRGKVKSVFMVCMKEGLIPKTFPNLKVIALRVVAQGWMQCAQN
jgi:hypothetical protein